MLIIEVAPGVGCSPVRTVPYRCPVITTIEAVLLHDLLQVRSLQKSKKTLFYGKMDR